MQMGEDLQRGTQPGVDLTRDGGRDREGCRGCTAHGRVVEPGAHDIERQVGSLQGSGVTSTDDRGGCGEFAGARPHPPVPQESVDLAAGCIARLVDAREGDETGEGVAQ